MKLEINKLKNLTYVTVSKTSILILFILLIGCIKPDNEIGNINKEAYYNFKDDDKQKLLSYLENQQINFKNQSGQERIFKITSVSKYYRNSYTVGMGFFTSYAAKYFDYDEKKVYLCDEMCGNFEITFSRWPINTELAKSNINIEYPSSFKGYITYSNER